MLSSAFRIEIILYAVNPSPNTWADKRVVNDFSALTAINNKPFVTVRYKNGAGSGMNMALNGIMISGTYTP
jgi:hypothetical protein